MNKRTLMTITLIGFLAISYLPLVSAETFEINSNIISITEINDNYMVKEHITVQNAIIKNDSYYLIHIPIDAEELKIIIENNITTNPIQQDDYYLINLSNINLLDSDLNIDVTYYLPLSTLYFSKTFMQNTSIFQIKFDNSKIYSSFFEGKDSSIEIKFTKTAAPESYNFYTTILIVLLVIIVIVTSWYAFIKRKNGKERKRSYETSELLEIEKSLLLNILKEIEKMHRNQKISDESYNKLKSHYKQQTVEIMTILDGINN